MLRIEEKEREIDKRIIMHLRNLFFMYLSRCSLRKIPLMSYNMWASQFKEHPSTDRCSADSTLPTSLPYGIVRTQEEYSDVYLLLRFLESRE